MAPSTFMAALSLMTAPLVSSALLVAASHTSPDEGDKADHCCRAEVLQGMCQRCFARAAAACRGLGARGRHKTAPAQQPEACFWARHADAARDRARTPVGVSIWTKDAEKRRGKEFRSSPCCTRAP